MNIFESQSNNMRESYDYRCFYGMLFVIRYQKISTSFSIRKNYEYIVYFIIDSNFRISRSDLAKISKA